MVFFPLDTKIDGEPQSRYNGNEIKYKMKT